MKALSGLDSSPVYGSVIFTSPMLALGHRRSLPLGKRSTSWTSLATSVLALVKVMFSRTISPALSAGIFAGLMSISTRMSPTFALLNSGFGMGGRSDRSWELVRTTELGLNPLAFISLSRRSPLSSIRDRFIWLKLDLALPDISPSMTTSFAPRFFRAEPVSLGRSFPVNRTGQFRYEARVEAFNPKV